MKLQEIAETVLPSPFRDYWFSKERLERKWRFFLSENKELFIQDEHCTFLCHWTQTNCCGVLMFIHEQKIPVKNYGVVCICGCMQFRAKTTEIGIDLTCIICGKSDEFSW